MLTYYIWTNKFYSKKFIKENYTNFLEHSLDNHSYRQRLAFCILFSIFSIPIDIIFCLAEIIYYIIETFIDM